MAITYTNGDGTTPVQPSVRGDEKFFDLVLADTAYATGGSVIDPKVFGFAQIVDVKVGNTLGGKPCAAVLSAGVWSVKMFSAIGTEVVNGTDVSTTDPYHVTVLGK